MERVGPYRMDKHGNRWVCIGPVAPPRTHGPEFGFERAEPMPTAEPLTTSAEAYADACRIGPSIDWLIGRAKKRTAQRFVALFEEHGGRLRLDGETLRAGPPELVGDEERKLIPLIKAEIVALVSEREAALAPT